MEESKGEDSKIKDDDFALLDEKENPNSICEWSQSQASAKNGSTGKIDLKLAVYLTKILLECGVRQEDIAIITPLNYEKNYIQSKLDVI